MNISTLKKYIQTAIFALLLCFGAVPATAQALVVNFETTPLFSDADVKPGDSTTRTVTVENDTSESQAVYAAANNVFSTGLADVMNVEVTDGVTTLFSGSFNDFFAASPVALTTLGVGNTQTYFFSASIPDGVGNAYQLTTFGFDLVIGFEGGASTTDGGGGGGGGGGSSSSLFDIFNENVVGVSIANGGATVTWNTSSNATSYLVCGNIVDGPFMLDPGDSQFGYPLSVAEVDNQVTTHAVDISGLALGTYECRPASRQGTGDDFSVGDAVQFTLALPGIVAGVTDTTNIGTTYVPPTGPAGAVRGAATDAQGVDGDEVLDSEEVLADEETGIERTTSVLQDALTVLSDGDCLYIWLLLLSAMMFVWSVIDDFLKHRDRLHKRWLFRNTMFAGVFAALVWFLRDTVFLQTFWWLFAGAWVVMTITDYRVHATDMLRNSSVRNIFYALVSLALIVSSIMFSFPCVWWPFAAIGVVSLLVWLIEKRAE